MIACRVCGEPVDELVLRCPSCGSALDGSGAEETDPRFRSVFKIVGALAVVAIVVASLLLRRPPRVEAFAEPARQRAAVQRFERLVVAADWTKLFDLVAEPPASEAAAFASLMEDRVARQGRIASIELMRMRLRRSATVPVLEVRERVRMAGAGGSELRESVFVWHGGRWLFGFSGPAR